MTVINQKIIFKVISLIIKTLLILTFLIKLIYNLMKIFYIILIKDKAKKFYLLILPGVGTSKSTMNVDTSKELGKLLLSEVEEFEKSIRINETEFMLKIFDDYKELLFCPEVATTYTPLVTKIWEWFNSGRLRAQGLFDNCTPWIIEILHGGAIESLYSASFISAFFIAVRLQIKWFNRDMKNLHMVNEFFKNGRLGKKIDKGTSQSKSTRKLIRVLTIGILNGTVHNYESSKGIYKGVPTRGVLMYTKTTYFLLTNVDEKYLNSKAITFIKRENKSTILNRGFSYQNPSGSSGRVTLAILGLTLPPINQPQSQPQTRFVSTISTPEKQPTKKIKIQPDSPKLWSPGSVRSASPNPKPTPPLLGISSDEESTSSSKERRFLDTSALPGHHNINQRITESDFESSDKRIVEISSDDRVIVVSD